MKKEELIDEGEIEEDYKVIITILLKAKNVGDALQKAVKPEYLAFASETNIEKL